MTNGSITKTKTGEHNGWPWEISVTKHADGNYTAEAVMCCQMHTVTVRFPDNTTGTLLDGDNYLPYKPGAYLTENPFRWIVQFVEGFINGRNELVNQLLDGGDATKQELIKLINQEE